MSTKKICPDMIEEAMIALGFGVYHVMYRPYNDSSVGFGKANNIHVVVCDIVEIKGKYMAK